MKRFPRFIVERMAHGGASALRRSKERNLDGNGPSVAWSGGTQGYP